MKKYFLAPRSGEKSYKNFESTIKNGVPLERISRYLTVEEKHVLSSEEIIYAWANREGTKSAWDSMDIGDSVLFYAKGSFVMVGDVYFKKHDPNLALSMWPADDNGKPWEYTFFLKNIRYITIPIVVFNAAAQYKSNFVIQGFIPLKPDRVENISSLYGSVEAMLNFFSDGNSSEIPRPGDRLYVNVPENIKPILIEGRKIVPKSREGDISKKIKKIKKIDYLLRSKNNSITGNKGEEIVLKYEKEFLNSKGLHDLAERVNRVSTENDTLGYDVLSFDIDGKEKMIEVKTTTQDKNSLRFFVSLNEYSVGKNSDNYFIYYVEDVNSNQPKITIIQNPMDESRFLIEPDGYVFSADRLIE